MLTVASRVDHDDDDAIYGCLSVRLDKNEPAGSAAGVFRISEFLPDHQLDRSNCRFPSFLSRLDTTDDSTSKTHTKLITKHHGEETLSAFVLVDHSSEHQSRSHTRNPTSPHRIPT
jgi:hypothetical protein